MFAVNAVPPAGTVAATSHDVARSAILTEASQFTVRTVLAGLADLIASRPGPAETTLALTGNSVADGIVATFADTFTVLTELADWTCCQKIGQLDLVPPKS